MNWLLRKLGLVRYSLVVTAVSLTDRDQREEAKERRQVRLVSAWAVMTRIDYETRRHK